jgi:hypothetical protein
LGRRVRLSRDFVKPSEQMRSLFFALPVTILAGIALCASAVPLFSQSQTDTPAMFLDLPTAPEPAQPIESSISQQPSSGPQSTTTTPAPSQADSEKSKHDLAEEQLKAQEKQRVMGVMATFNTTRNQDAVPLSPGQKFKLFFKSSTDPWPFLLAGAVAGIGQADDSYPTWGQGAQGYAKRYGAAYSDAFIGNFFGNAVLPVVLREDPRYFQKGTGSATKRFLWAAGSTFWCKRDNGKWGPNYANVGGNLIGAAIARAYYPPAERTFSDTITDGITVSVEGIVGAELIEFWPDLVRHFRQKKTTKIAETFSAGLDQTR